jgi:hypothetical protein
MCCAVLQERYMYRAEIVDQHGCVEAVFEGERAHVDLRAAEYARDNWSKWPALVRAEIPATVDEQLKQYFCYSGDTLHIRKQKNE